MIRWFGWFTVFNATFNNISAILWRSVLLVEKTRVPGENHWQTLSQYTLPWTGFELTTLLVIDIDFTSSCQFNYHTIMTTTVLCYLDLRLQGQIICAICYALLTSDRIRFDFTFRWNFCIHQWKRWWHNLTSGLVFRQQRRGLGDTTEFLS